MDDYPPDLASTVRSVYTEPGFFLGLPSIPGAISGFKMLTEAFPDTWICSAPLTEYELCVGEKYRWVETFLGRTFTERIILTRNKSLIDADVLIDDNPEPIGWRTARWQQLLFDAPYNRDVRDRRRFTWDSWSSVMDTIVPR